MLGEGISHESRALVHDVARVMSARGEWGVADLLIYLQSGEADGESVGDGVTVCTVHAAKGREWGAVFMVGLEEGTFPSAKALKADRLVECHPEANPSGSVAEERRLAFVAFTRAKDRLYLTRSETRCDNRGPNLPPGPPTPREPSRFVKEAGLTS
jgi:DNA helicase-2/ATP-dependent DNA helicase PcrA